MLRRVTEINKTTNYMIFDGIVDQFTPFTSHYKTNTFIFIYSCDDYQSFQNVEKWILLIFKKHELPLASGILVGTKLDLPNKVVSTDEGRSLAMSYGFKFFEVSPKMGTNMEELFGVLCEMVELKAKRENKNNNNQLVQLSKKKNPQGKKCEK